MDEIAEFRRFSRFYTRVVGALDTGHLDTPFSLSEARRRINKGQAALLDALADTAKP